MSNRARFRIPAKSFLKALAILTAVAVLAAGVSSLVRYRHRREVLRLVERRELELARGPAASDRAARAAAGNARGDDACPASTLALIGNGERPQRCFCGSDLAKIKVTLPKTLRLVAACELRDALNGAIDPRRQKIDLDQWGSHAEFPFGVYFVSGQMELSGVVNVRTEPDEGTDAPFAVQYAKTGSVFVDRFLLGDISFGPADWEKFHPPQVRGDECRQAVATVRIQGFRVRIDDSDIGGTIANHADVLAISDYRNACES